MGGGYPPFRNATIKIGAMLPKKLSDGMNWLQSSQPEYKSFPEADDLSGTKIIGAGTID